MFDTPLNMFMRGKGRIKEILMSENLIKIFNKRGIK